MIYVTLELIDIWYVLVSKKIEQNYSCPEEFTVQVTLDSHRKHRKNVPVLMWVRS